MKHVQHNGQIIKHYTAKEIGPSIFCWGKWVKDHLITPTSCGTGEYILIGRVNKFKAVLVQSPYLPDVEDLSPLFNLPKHPDGATVVQYNSRLGGYLFTFSNLD
jgi:hypothetical protein